MPKISHRMSQTRIYHIWTDMVARCHNPKNKDYKSYGGKGIRVCEEWLQNFERFVLDTKDNYKDHLTIDRINSKLGYSLTNIRWVSMQENCKKGFIFKVVNQYNLDGSLVATFTSQREAGRLTGICFASIRKVVKGLRNTAGGYFWKYEEVVQ